MREIFMLDTDICSYIMKGSHLDLLSIFEIHQNNYDEICISVVTHAEILYGINIKNSHRLEAKYKDFAALLKIIEWDYRSAEKYADIKKFLKRAGTPIGNMDMMIASSALSIGANLVTNNKKHFSLVPHLKIADWLN